MFKLFFVTLFFGFLLTVPLIVRADEMAEPAPSGETATVDCPPGRQCLENPLTRKVDVTSLIGIVIKAALGIIGSITLLMLVWGGFQWLTSAGNDEKVDQGTKTMLWAAIGLAVVFGSYLFLTAYIRFLTGGK